MELGSHWRVLVVTKVVPTGRRPPSGRTIKITGVKVMNIHSDQRSGYGNDNKTAPSGSSGRSTTGDINADLNTLRSDFNALKDTVTDFVSKTGSDALDSAKKATSDVANKASDLASAASEQAKTFASELERMGRNNPLGAIAGALVVGVVIGLIGRGGRS
jgi:ElaB/YqjD/DUF883 family membrane-anchored ribosome-binding protein